jgi:hypothetical protein
MHPVGEGEVLLVDPFAVEERAWMDSEIMKTLSSDKNIIMGSDLKLKSVKEGHDIVVCKQTFTVGTVVFGVILG